MNAEVAVFAGVRGPPRTFTYAVPDGLVLQPGHLVRVALGRRSAAGIVVAIDVPSPAAALRSWCPAATRAHTPSTGTGAP